jgi:hypothetical protein
MFENFFIQVNNWNKKTLTWKLGKSTPDMTEGSVRYKNVNVN